MPFVGTPAFAKRLTCIAAIIDKVTIPVPFDGVTVTPLPALTWETKRVVLTGFCGIDALLKRASPGGLRDLFQVLLQQIAAAH